MKVYTFKVELLVIEHMNLQHEQVAVTDLDLRDCERDNRGGYVIVKLRDECECQHCDGSGDCQNCNGNPKGCRACWGGECPNCDGSGHETEWIPVYLDEQIWESIQAHKRAQKLLEKRYGTSEPITICDWWLL